ncbi:MFS transporter [Lichenibacterium dinghuense]|uniref:MFS transporter n=1 Tax=Lichenibacterium dinghuense TaxID=2895977 RepID=UPI001F18077A|nr:MFS transporter [Lichenibacterium sp. 6Y81]
MKVRYRWVILAFLFSAMLINYMDRAALSVAMPFMTKDFALSPTEKGLIFSSFFIGYALFNVVGGVLSDRIGPKRVFSWSMALWSVFCGATAGVFGVGSLFAVRVLFGMGEGPISATANKAVHSWFPLGERARAIGINQAGGPLGGALAGPVVGFLALTTGWRTAFVVVAVLGLAWTLAWHFVAADDPRTSPHVSAAERAEILDGAAPPSPSARPVPLSALLRRPVIFVMAFSLFCCSYNQFFFLTWFPTFLVDAKKLSLSQMSVVASVPWLLGALGYIMGGVLIDAVFRATGRRLFSRKAVLVLFLALGGACVAGAGSVETATQSVTLMSVAVCFIMLTSTAYWALIQLVVPGEAVGGASGLMHGLGNVSGIVGPALTGWIVQDLGGYAAAFHVAGGLAVAGALSVAFLVRDAAAERAGHLTAALPRP